MAGTLFFYCLAMLHSVWTGWLAPLGLLSVKRLFPKQRNSKVPAVVWTSLSILAGLLAGVVDTQVVRVAPSVGTGALVSIAWVSLGHALFSSGSDVHERWCFGLHGLFMVIWIITFFVLV